MFNETTIETSYSCVRNIKQQIVDNRSKEIIRENETEGTTPREFKCREESTLPEAGKYCISDIICQVTVTKEDNSKKETYTGSSQ